MLHPRQPIADVLAAHPADLYGEIDRQIAQHEERARVTSSEAAYTAAMKMARTLRAAKAHLQADDLDAVCCDLSAWIMVSEVAERAARLRRFAPPEPRT